MTEPTARVLRLPIEDSTPSELWRADRAVQHLTGASRRQTNGLFDEGCVSLNGQPCGEPWRHLTLGDVVQVAYDPDQRYRAARKPPKYLGFDILYEDPSLLVVDKPAAWLTVPASPADRQTLIQRIEQYVAKQNRGRWQRLPAAHRLDRGVSGLLVCGKTPEICADLRRQFVDRTPDRRYVAIVAGVVAEDQGELRSYLTTDERLNRQTTDDPEQGELAVLRFTVLRRLSDTTLVAIELDTGRRHQIRVQLAAHGHGVLGDSRYGRPGSAHPRWTAPRLALHAEYLAFTHPVDGRRLEFTVPWPAEFQDFLSAAAQPPAAG